MVGSRLQSVIEEKNSGGLCGGSLNDKKAAVTVDGGLVRAACRGAFRRLREMAVSD
jgi:hypothetical protein